MCSRTSFYNITASPFSKRTTLHGTCQTLKLLTAAWNHRPFWCELPVGWVTWLIINDQKSSLLHNKLRLIATWRWDYYIRGWSCCCKSFKIRSIPSPAWKGPPCMMIINKPIKLIAIWNSMRRLYWQMLKRDIRKSSQWSIFNDNWRDYWW